MRDITKKWIGVDFDRTLAVREDGQPIEQIGAPIDQIVELVNNLLKNGVNVKIFTARVHESAETLPLIDKFCEDNFGRKLDITNIKDRFCAAIIDDKAFHFDLKFNTLYNKDELLSLINKDFQKEIKFQELFTYDRYSKIR